MLDDHANRPKEMTRPSQLRYTLVVLLALAPAMTGCLAMSSYQSARITEPGPARTLFAVSKLGETADEDRDDEVTILVVDMRVRKGVVRHVADLNFNTTLLTTGGGAMLAVGLEPRLSIVPNVLAMGLPVGYFLGAPFPYGLQWAPGFVATVPVSRQFEVNGGIRMMSVYGGDHDIPIYNVGIAFSRDLRESAIRPEVAFTPNEDGEGWLLQVGVGFEPRRPEAGD